MGDDGRRFLATIAVRMLAEIDDLVAAMQSQEADLVPILAADRAIEREVMASNRANVEVVARVIVATPVDQPIELPAAPPPEALDVVRTVVRRGLDMDLVFQAYLRGQAFIWTRAMQIAEHTDAPATAQMNAMGQFGALLFTYVDSVLVALMAEGRRLREAMAGGGLAKRVETVRLLLDGAPIEEKLASERLGYELSGRHTALMLWLDGAARDGGELEAVAGALARKVGARSPLTVVAGVRSLWVWIPAGNQFRPSPQFDWNAAEWETDLGEVALHTNTKVRVAVGRTMSGVAGFRGSHADAQAVAHLVGANADGPQLTTFTEVEPLLPMLRDPRAAARFVRHVLADLARDDERGARLRETLRIFLLSADSASAAAQTLNTHRNTVLQRVAVATELMGYQSGTRRLAVMMALDVVHYVGRGILTG